MVDEILDMSSKDSGSYNLGLTNLHPPYKSVIRIGVIIFTLPLLIAAAVGDFALSTETAMFPGTLFVPVLLLAVMAIVLLPQRRYRRWGYDKGDAQLRVLRGYLFRTDTIVPFNRIQHIDIAQGPIERMYDVSNLIVHTAGTHNNTVTLPGLQSDVAEAMREEMRGHIKREMI